MRRRRRRKIKKFFASIIPGIRLWWKEATGRIRRSRHRNYRQAVFRRVLLWIPVLAVVGLILAYPAVKLFMLWRAYDLAHKSVASFERKEYRLAFLQSESAGALKPDLAPVVRARALSRTGLGDRSSLAYWKTLRQMGEMNDEDLSAWAEAAAVLGTDADMSEVKTVLDNAGRTGEANAWRSRRAFRYGNLVDAEKFMRAAIAENDSIPLQLELARVLAAIGTPDATAEAVRIVSSAAAGPEANKALAFGLTYIPVGPATRRTWAERALANLSSDNEALLPAASAMVNDRHWTTDEAVAQLAPVFVGAPLKQRVKYVSWLAEKNRPREEVLRSVTSREAKHSPEVFRLRADEAVEARDWQEVLRLLDAGSPLDEAASQLLRAKAEAALGRTALAQTALRRAVRASVNSLTLPETLAEVDARNESGLADEVLLEMCGEPALAEYVLRVARYRFGMRGEPRLIDEGMSRYPVSENPVPTVRDFRWRKSLLAGERVDPALTARVSTDEPTNVDFRITHALALLNDGRPAEARLALAALEPVSHQLFAGQQAVLAAVLAASGSQAEAARLARGIKGAHLTDPEYRLVLPILKSEGSQKVKAAN
ncbi:MAG: hypothetical protein FGM15_08085 [Chthoniobacterales bacterium]|nr:hypothetical protein [Chthoniobacterales bacterium]